VAVAAAPQLLNRAVCVLEVLAEHGERLTVVVWKPFAIEELIKWRDVRVLHGPRETCRLRADIDPSPSSTGVSGEEVVGAFVYVGHDVDVTPPRPCRFVAWASVLSLGV
jgi:hypothetical protein